MPLHMTKIAYGAESPATLRAWLESHGGAGEALLTTRYLPKRHEEMAGGSLYWIHGGMLVGRSPLIGFADAPDGRIHIRLRPLLIGVETRPRRMHQGWRYLEAADAPPDAADDGGADLPPALAGELTRLGLL